MDFKKELKKLVTIVKDNAKKAGQKVTNEQIAERMGYSRTYFSTLTGKTGKVEKEHIDNFKAHFHLELEGIVKPSTPGDALNRERALVKMLYQRVAKLESERLGVPLDKVMDEMERDTMIAWKDLEKE